MSDAAMLQAIDVAAERDQARSIAARLEGENAKLYAALRQLVDEVWDLGEARAVSRTMVNDLHDRWARFLMEFDHEPFSSLGRVAKVPGS